MSPTIDAGHPAMFANYFHHFVLHYVCQWCVIHMSNHACSVLHFRSTHRML